MRVILYSTSVWSDSDERYYIIGSIRERYDGPFAFAKKGREIVKQNAQADQAAAAQNRTNSQNAYNTAQSTLQEDLGSSTPGSLTPAATAQLAADRDNIARTYNGLRQNAFSTIGARGFGSAPGGIGQATVNALNVGQEGSDTGAYRNAQVNTQNQRNFATGEEGKLSGQEGSLGNQASGESTTAGYDLNKMGSTAGDILGAAAQLAPIVAAPFTGGASLLASGAGGMFNRIGKTAGGSSGVGGYNPGVSGPAYPG